jgi:hypothetical protein
MKRDLDLPENYSCEAKIEPAIFRDVVEVLKSRSIKNSTIDVVDYNYINKEVFKVDEEVGIGYAVLELRVGD